MKTLAKKPIWRSNTLVLLLCLSPLIAAGCAANAPPGTNNPPIANAGADQVVNTGAIVTLDGSASSDPEGTPLSFSWKQTAGTPVLLDNITSATLTFKAPSDGTAMVFELTVSDGQNSSVGSVHVSVHPVVSSVQLVELRQRPITDDIAVTGNFPAGFTIPGLPSGPLGTLNPGETGAPDGVEKINFAPLVEVDLAPGATQEVDLQAAGPSLLLGSAKWSGTTDSLPVTLSFNGASVATGNDFSIGTDRGGAVVRAQTTAGGQASLLITNTSAVTVKVRIILGVFAL